MRSISTASAAETAAGPPDSIATKLDLLVRGLRSPDLVALDERLAQLLRAQQSSAGYPLARPRDFGRVTEALRGVLASAARAFATRDPAVLDAFFAVLDGLESAGIKIYPSEHAQLTLLRAEALLAVGCEAEAVNALAAMSARPHAVEGDAATFRRLFLADMTARFSAGEAASLTPVAMGRARFLTRMKPLSAPSTIIALAPMLADAAEHGQCAGLVRWAARRLVMLRLKRPLSPPGRLWRALALRSLVLTGSAGLLNLSLGRRPPPPLATAPRRTPSAGPTNPTAAFLAPPAARRPVSGAADAPRLLVSRAMGGLGDILLMTPGLRALAARTGRPVDFATKGAFFPILKGNPDVTLLDIDSHIDIEGYDHWTNLSNCPAGRIESVTRPRVRLSRVEIFARAMRVTRAELLRHGLQPRISLNPEEQADSARLRALYGASGRTVIGLQPYSRDTYKNHPEILAVAHHLAQDNHVLVFHNAPVPVGDNPNITVLSTRGLRDNIVHMQVCDYFIAVDSAFYHIAAALDVPSVGIFGPTDGRLFSLHHPRHLLAPSAQRFTCAPCWRNEDIPCYLTGSHQSACLTNVGVDAILETLDALRRQFPSCATLRMRR